MLREPAEAVRARAERLAALVGGEVEETVARVGGGALPLAELPSFACAVEESLAAPLRAGDPPVVGVVRDGRLLLDCRTLRDAEVDEVAAAVAAARAMSEPPDPSGTSSAARWDARAGARRRPRRRGRARRRPARRSPTWHARSAPTRTRCTASCARSRATESSPRTSPASSATPRPRSALRRDGWDDFAHLFGGVWLPSGRRARRATAGRRSRAVRHRLLVLARRASRGARRFDRAMEQGWEGRLERLASLDWRGDETVVDVGGGNGSLLLALLERHPGLRGIVFDLPETVRDESRFGDRIEFVAGDFFERVPAGDVYVLSTILHDWDDERAGAILRTVRAAAPTTRGSCCSRASSRPGNAPDGASGSTC